MFQGFPGRHPLRGFVLQHGLQKFLYLHRVLKGETLCFDQLLAYAGLVQVLDVYQLPVFVEEVPAIGPRQSKFLVHLPEHFLHLSQVVIVLLEALSFFGLEQVVVCN